MPTPNPKPDESRDAWMERWMGSEAVQNEYPDHKQRVAVGLSKWRRRKKRKSENRQS